MSLSSRERKDLDLTRQKRDEEAVGNVIKTIESMQNPFDLDCDELVQLSTGTIANNAVANDMQQAHDIGEGKLLNFVKERVLVDEPDIYSPIKKAKLRTFSSMSKVISTKNSNGSNCSLKNDRDLFARLLLIARSRDIDMQQLLSYALKSAPLPLANFNGSMVKTDKAKLMHAIEESVPDPVVTQVPALNALLVDAMALLQQLTKLDAKTFGDFADEILSLLISMAKHRQSSRVDFVCDRYPKASIKGSERERRAHTGSQVVRIYGREQKRPKQWKKFMAEGVNKEEIIQFLFQCWSKCNPAALRGIPVYVAHGNECHRISPSEDIVVVEEIVELQCDHEEADSRLFLHALHASQDHRNILLKSPDTDVFVIALYLNWFLPSSLYLETGSQNANRTLSIHAVAMAVGREVCMALPGLHAFTGKNFINMFMDVFTRNLLFTNAGNLNCIFLPKPMGKFK